MNNHTHTSGSANMRYVHTLQYVAISIGEEYKLQWKCHTLQHEAISLCGCSPIHSNM